MRGLRLLIRRSRLLAFALVLLALLMKGTVPAGAMVAPAGELKLVVTLCAEGMDSPAQVRLLIPRDVPRDTGGSEEDTGSAPCVFAAPAPLALAPHDVAGPVLAFHQAQPACPPETRPVATASAPRLRPPSRGPPA